MPAILATEERQAAINSAKKWPPGASEYFLKEYSSRLPSRAIKDIEATAMYGYSSVIGESISQVALKYG